MSTTPIRIEPVATRGHLRAFVRFPWRVYRGDKNWVPPLISDRIKALDPAQGPFYEDADVALFLARKGREVVGTIAAFVDRRVVELADQPYGAFGFFEVANDYAAAERLLGTACDWLRAQEIDQVRGPINFSVHDSPGVLVEGADCPPVLMEAHTPPYYLEFLERYGMEKHGDMFAWRAYREQIGDELKNIPPQLLEIAEAARRQAGVTIRTVRMDDWDSEIAAARHLFNDTLSHLPDHIPTSEAEFRRLAEQIRPFLNPDLAFFAEAEGQPVAFLVALPDLNQALVRLNGRLFPFGWLRLGRLIQQIDVVTFKLMGVLEKYRRRGIDAMLYMEAVKVIHDQGYAWLDGSLTSEYNPMINLIAQRLGAERYKHYRLYKMAL